MNIKEAKEWGKEILSILPYPKLEAETLLSLVLKKDRAFLFMHPERELKKKEWARYQKYIQKRTSRIPVAYIAKKKNWAGITLQVNRSVLIPRDETEFLCKYILSHEVSPKSIADIGTGSGNIAIFMKKFFPKAKVFAGDVSQKALLVAQKNAKKEKVSIRFFHSNLFESIPHPKEGYDIIIANLPYVPQEIPVSEEVKKEPKRAIFSKENGMFHIKCLAEELKRKKIKYKSLYLEFLPFQKKEVRKIFKDKKIKYIKNIEGEVFFAKISA